MGGEGEGQKKGGMYITRPRYPLDTISLTSISRGEKKRGGGRGGKRKERGKGIVYPVTELLSIVPLLSLLRAMGGEGEEKSKEREMGAVEEPLNIPYCLARSAVERGERRGRKKRPSKRGKGNTSVPFFSAIHCQ